MRLVRWLLRGRKGVSLADRAVIYALCIWAMVLLTMVVKAAVPVAAAMQVDFFHKIDRIYTWCAENIQPAQ